MRLFEVTALFLRLGITAFGGPAAHVALIQRECVDRRHWITREAFLDLLAVSSLIPGPTSTELAMHIGRVRAGWPGLVAAGVAFIAPAALFVGLLAAMYVRTGTLPMTRGVLDIVQPVVVLVVVQAILPLGRSALHSPGLAVLAVAALAAALAGVPEIVVLIAAGLVWTIRRPASSVPFIVCALGIPLLAAADIGARASVLDVATYFAGVGSLLFGSGYVLLPVLEGDLVGRLGWLTERELLDAVAAGQATPGPVFTTATFIGYLLGGSAMALVATVAMFLPAFVFSALSSLVFEWLKASPRARLFLDGVNAAAVALIGVVTVMLGRVAFDGPVAIVAAIAAAAALFLTRVNPAIVLVAAAVFGGAFGWWSGE